MSTIKPEYYQSGPNDVTAFAKKYGLGFALGNVVKYVVRAGKKGDAMEDLLKAREYLDREIEDISKDTGKSNQLRRECGGCGRLITRCECENPIL